MADVESAGFSITPGGKAPAAAILVPGARYDMAAPLFAKLIEGLSAEGLGWVAISWTDSVHGHDLSTMCQLVDRAVRAVEALASQDATIVAKSLGTLAVATAEALHRPGVWWTPIVGSAADRGGYGAYVRERLVRRSRADLVFGGSADALWDRTAIPSQHQTVEFPGADHGLEIDGDPAATAAIHEAVSSQTLEFIRGHTR